MRNPRELLVVALGGNAFFRHGEVGTFEEQHRHIRSTARHLADLIENGYRLVITHGNGPQIGETLLRHEAGEKLYGIPALPMDVCVAETQGFIGYMIQQALRSELKRRKLEGVVLTVLTRVIVDRRDKELKKPVKPVGPFYSKEEFEKVRAKHPEYAFAEDKSRGGWRRIVPSPNPLRIGIAEQASILLLVKAGCTVIACGGGGIPVIEDSGWHAKGIEAVIDKDLAGERLATLIRADKYLMLTDVNGAYSDYKTPKQRLLRNLTAKEARSYLKAGHFAHGSMEPKILAAARFVENGGKASVIAELSQVEKAVVGEAGTLVLPDQKAQSREK